MRNPKILLGLTGSVAAALAPKIIEKLKEIGPLSVMMTESAEKFIPPQDLISLLGISIVPHYSDRHGPFTDFTEWAFEPAVWQKGTGSVLHIELRKWADILVIAPLSANTLAKMAGGLCDNLLTSVFRAWDLHKPVVVAPAMNTLMWKHPVTREHLEKVNSWLDEFCVVEPQEKRLACGDTGEGALADIDLIAKTVDRMTSDCGA